MGRSRKGVEMLQRQTWDWCMVDGWKGVGCMFEGCCEGALLPPRRCIIVTVGGVARETHGIGGGGERCKE